MKLPFEVIFHSGKMPFYEVIDSREWIPFIILADAHAGAGQFRDDIFRRVVSKAVELQAPVVGLGDLFENATKRSVGKGVFEQVLSPREQVTYLKAALAPVKDQIVELLPGNHEYRTEKDNDVSPLDTLCEGLDVPQGKYTSRIVFRSTPGSKSANRKAVYTFRGTHSKSSAKTSGLSQNSIERDWEKWQQYDIIAKAHGHDMYVSEPKVYEHIDVRNKCVVTKERYFVTGGHYLDYPEGYTDQHVLRPKPLGTMIVWMHMQKEDKDVRGERVK